MKKVTRANYQKDKYYPRVARAVSALLTRSDEVTPLQVFCTMGVLSETDVEAWRHGRIPYLERVIQCNLSTASRVLRMLSWHAKTLHLTPAMGQYRRKTARGGRVALLFSKSGDPNIEAAYARHYVKRQDAAHENSAAWPSMPKGCDP